jgi:ParB family chromosome partitioning protein
VAPALAPTDGLLHVDIDLIDPSPYQPRTRFREEALDELARSIRASGIVQPLVVRRTARRYQLIAGERRWRAAQRAALGRVPVVIREVPDEMALEMTLVENLQREDLNPIEQALAYRRLSDEFQLTQEDIAEAIGKDRTSIANYLRLLKLPEEVRADVSSGALSMGHARALLALSSDVEQRRLARDVINRSLSVRETESLVKRAGERGDAPPLSTPPKPVDVHTHAAEERLKFVLGTRVRIVRRGKRGRIEIDFASEEELIRLYDQLTSR